MRRFNRVSWKRLCNSHGHRVEPYSSYILTCLFFQSSIWDLIQLAFISNTSLAHYFMSQFLVGLNHLTWFSDLIKDKKKFVKKNKEKKPWSFKLSAFQNAIIWSKTQRKMSYDKKRKESMCYSQPYPLQAWSPQPHRR